ncbi:hypothetical protein [Halomonas lysinitropha]|uniref:SGNH/GDSL hydrolase family protein n=1 Tax=Halomonas lysinitropha TaxID=2607506 RepID=A0A5K1I5T4_9GAMM|nr:hypothetical protein [Halomonas lysinitropha]VVZ95528.1 hypothetical protein HALO32_01599 [Halomonas lysinitropha]
MKICFIGNSHAGAIRRGLELVDDSLKDGIDITFFAYGGRGFSRVYAEGEALVTDNSSLREGLRFTSGGLESIVPSEYDIIVIYGLGFYSYFPFDASRYSDAVLQNSCLDSFSNSLAGHLYREVSKTFLTNSIKKILACSTPFPAKSENHSKEEIERHFDRSSECYSNALRRIGCDFFYQPLQTLSGVECTKESFSKGSLKLATGDENDDLPHDISDKSHMNEVFGKYWIEHFLKKLGSN